jgi:hypothetical protein
VFGADARAIPLWTNSRGELKYGRRHSRPAMDCRSGHVDLMARESYISTLPSSNAVGRSNRPRELCVHKVQPLREVQQSDDWSSPRHRASLFSACLGRD